MSCSYRKKKGGCLIFTSYGGTNEAQIASAPIWAGIGFVLKYSTVHPFPVLVPVAIRAELSEAPGGAFIPILIPPPVTTVPAGQVAVLDPPWLGGIVVGGSATTFVVRNSLLGPAGPCGPGTPCGPCAPGVPGAPVAPVLLVFLVFLVLR